MNVDEALRLLRGGQDGIEQWNQRREKGENIPSLREVNLSGVDLSGANLSGVYLYKADLSKSRLFKAHLQKTDLCGADLRKANCHDAKLNEARLTDALLHEADLILTDLSQAQLIRTALCKADLNGTNLTGANLYEADLRGATFDVINKNGVELVKSNLQGANMRAAIVDGETLFGDCLVDNETDCTMVGLASARINPQLRETLEKNIRMIAWKTNCPLSRPWYWPIRLFLWISDYGSSTLRIIGVLFSLALLFSFVYCIFPHLISNLQIVSDSGAIQEFHGFRLWSRSFYLSIVTMTTLGFGDMHANPATPWGEVCLWIEVLLGYVLFSALVTRLGILFRSVS